MPIRSCQRSCCAYRRSRPLSACRLVGVFVEHAAVLLDRLRLVADAVLVRLGQLELGGEQQLRFVDRLHLALEHVDQVGPLGAIAVDALERLERVELRRHRVERFAVQLDRLLGRVELLFLQLAEAHADLGALARVFGHLRQLAQHLRVDLPLLRSADTGPPSASSRRGSAGRPPAPAADTGSRTRGGPHARTSARTSGRSRSSSRRSLRRPPAASCWR